MKGEKKLMGLLTRDYIDVGKGPRRADSSDKGTGRDMIGKNMIQWVLVKAVQEQNINEGTGMTCKDNRREVNKSHFSRAESG